MRTRHNPKPLFSPSGDARCRVRILELRPQRSVTFQRTVVLQPSFAPKTGRARTVVPRGLLRFVYGLRQRNLGQTLCAHFQRVLFRGPYKCNRNHPWFFPHDPKQARAASVVTCFGLAPLAPSAVHNRPDRRAQPGLSALVEDPTMPKGWTQPPGTRGIAAILANCTRPSSQACILPYSLRHTLSSPGLELVSRLRAVLSSKSQKRMA